MSIGPINLRMTLRRVIVIKTQQYFRRWFGKRIAGAIVKVKSHIILTFHLAFHNLTKLKCNFELFFNFISNISLLNVYLTFVSISTTTKIPKLVH